MSIKLDRWALEKVQSKPSPKVIPIAGDEEKVAARDYFSLYLKHGEENYLFEKIEADVVHCLSHDAAQDRYVTPVEFPLSKVGAMQPTCLFYNDIYQFKYTSFRSMFFDQMLNLWLFKEKKDKLAQWFFNRRSVPIVARYELMKYIADRWFTDPNFYLNLYTRLTEVYGNRWVRRPDHEFLVRREKLLLQSFIETGELTAVHGGLGFKVEPKILVSLETLTMDERRQRRGNRIQWALFAVAFFSTLAAAVQAWVAYHSIGK